jgi:hypothetical protein
MEKISLKDEMGFCTRQSDGVSGMTLTSLADFCGVDQPAITQWLNKIRDSDPITNDLPESLKHLAANDWRLITKDAQNSLFVIDELCHAVLEYYAIDARKYKGKAIAVENYRMIAKAGMRIFIWSQTGFSPQSQSLSSEQIDLLSSIPAMQQAIASLVESNSNLQSQVQSLLPPAPNSIPPGWDAEVWHSLPPQDKSHFRFLHKRRNFNPNPPNQLPPITTQLMKAQQAAEVARLVGDVSDEELQRFKDAKITALKSLWLDPSVPF